MSKIRFTLFLLLAAVLLTSLIWGIHLGHPPDIRMEASTL